MSFNSQFSDSTDLLMKSLIALGIITIVIALIVFFYNITKGVIPEELQIAVSGAIILVFSFLAHRIFSGL